MNRQAAFQVRSEARGPHWVAWVERPDQAGPYRSVLLVGASQKEAESRARAWGAEAQAQVENSSASS